MPSTYPLNVTQSRLRREGSGTDFRKYQVDPTWGIPEPGCPMWLDLTTGYVRPASSGVTVSLVCATFVGFAKDYFPPGEMHVEQICLKGWAEMILDTAAAVIPGETYKFVTETDGADIWVSNSTVTKVTDQVGDTCQPFSVVEGCYCEIGTRVNCPPALPVGVDVSPASAPTRPTQRTVLVAYDAS